MREPHQRLCATKCIDVTRPNKILAGNRRIIFLFPEPGTASAALRKKIIDVTGTTC
jgi:hypothetical protein